MRADAAASSAAPSAGRFSEDGDGEAAGTSGTAGALAWLRQHGALRDNPLCSALAVATSILLCRHLRFDAADGHWPDRDRLVVGASLQAMVPLLAEVAGADAGFAVSLPDPPGQALGAGLGLALAERHLAARFGRSLVDHRIWVLATAADLATGLAQEVVHVAGSLRLGRLTVLVALQAQEPVPAGFGANWTVRRASCDDEPALRAALSAALRSHKPTLIACLARAPAPGAHGRPGPVTPAPAGIGGRGAAARRAWLRRLARHTAREVFDRCAAARLPPAWHGVFSEPGPLLTPGQEAIAPLATVRQAFARLAPILPELVCLTADQGHGEATRMGAGQPAPAWQTSVQALAGAVCGLARHAGVLPVGFTRLSDIECLAPSLRNAAQAGLRAIHVVAEPASACPTAGHRAGLRAMRNVFVFRPADAAEALECAELALRRSHGPSVLLLSEVACAPLTDRPTRSRCVHGGFLARAPAGPRDVTLIASGAELALALRAQDALAGERIAAAVVSLPCWELFANQEAAWREQVLGTAPRLGVEAGSGFGWERWLGPGGAFVGSDEGAIKVERIVAAAKALAERR